MAKRGKPANIKRLKLKEIFGELKENPPKILAVTRRKSGKTRANKQRIAIALSKARHGN